MAGVVEEVRRFAQANELLASPGVVAVSGGPDSVALLRALRDAGCEALAAAHVNHQLRGPESDEDETFVRTLAEELRVECRVKRIDTAKLAEESRENLEATARRIRYDWFEGMGAAWFATGHTADDQAETVLHRLIRGAGLRGLRGIARRRERIVRPLLDVTRADVLDYLASIGQPYRTDSSNADPRFTRNRIRHELLPLVKSLNPAIVRTLGEAADQAGEAFAHIEAEAKALHASAEKPRAGRMLIFDAERLASAPPFLTCEALRAVWAREGWSEGQMSAEHWRRLEAIVRGELSAADFPDGVTARRVGRVVQIERRT